MRHKTVTAPSSATTVAVAPDVREIRAQLQQQRNLRVDQLDQLAADAADAFAAADDGWLQVTSVVTMTAESALDEINAALQRLDQGCYGTCERCAVPIPSERLEVLPMSRLCTSCQSLTESRRSRP